jgi:tRNA modification GTPase
MTATYVACLTPPGRGAIATLAVRGPEAWDVTRNLFRPVSLYLPDEPQPHSFWFGRLGGELADEVVVSVQRGGQVPWIDIHCHGGPEAIRLLIGAFAAQGVQPCSWQELVLVGAAPGSRALAEIELTYAPTVRTAGILLDQVEGALDRSLVEVRAALERRDGPQAETLLAELTRFTAVGRHLTVPWSVAVIGPPNVGKSSLVNALAGFQRSIVSSVPGTTRDVVTTAVAVDGWPVELADTAGLRGSAGDIEGEGIARALSAAAEADLCLWMLDASAPPVWPKHESASLRYVINKIDVPPAWDIATAPGAVAVSARTGQGLGELCEAIAHWLVPAAPPAGAAVPFSAGLAEQVLALAEIVRSRHWSEASQCWDAFWQNPSGSRQSFNDSTETHCY